MQNISKINSLMRARASHVELAKKVDPATHHLSFAQKMQIVSRRDRMGRTKPGALRVLAASLVLLVLVIVGGAVRSHALNTMQQKPLVPVGENEVQFSFAGDLMVGRYVQTYGEKKGYDEIFSCVKPLWENSSLVFANLECAILNGDKDDYPEADKLVIHGTRDGLKAAVDAGINVFSVANNHAVDYGRAALRETLESITEFGAEYAGAGANWEEAPSYRVLDADGMKVGYVACTNFVPPHFAATVDDYGVCSTNNSRTYRNLLKASLESDVTIAYVHFGKENVPTVTDSERKIAHQLIESGADVVIGCHPHVLQPVEFYKNGIIFYSLGNFVFDQGQRPARNTTLLQMNVNRETGAVVFTLIPMHIDEFRPHVTDNPLYLSQIQDVLTESLPEGSYTITESGLIQIPFQVDLHQ